MRHLYLKIYLAFMVVVIIAAAAAALAGRLLREDFGEMTPTMQGAAQLIADQLPEDDPSAMAAELDTLASQLGLRVGIYDARGEPLAVSRGAAEILRRPKPGTEAGWWRRKGYPGVWVELNDGRWLSATTAHDHEGWAVRFFGVLLVLVLALAIGCYPIARRITHRLEQLQRGVETLGKGELSARVDVHGADEVAQLALAFNEAATKIEALVASQKRVLASASHELRSPLTRLRMAVELLGESAGAGKEEMVEGAARDIEELDETVGDILLGARLEAVEPSQHDALVDLAALVRDEAARTGAQFTSEDALELPGDAKMLRRMLRNLLENARRHGGGDAVEVTLSRAAETVTLTVSDRGPGVAESERERIFEPFYRPRGHREGTHGSVGLGLALVRQIAAHHGGTARYEPRDGGGSCFVVELSAV